MKTIDQHYGKPDGCFAKFIKAKQDSRMDDEERINNGEDPHEIQKENSIFPPGFFENGTFNNFGKSVSS